MPRLSFMLSHLLRHTLRVLGLLGLGLTLTASPRSALSATPTTWADAPVTLIADDWCPQHCASNPKDKGYVVDIVSQALRAEGVPFSVRYMPWARGLSMVKRGDADGLLTPTVSSFPQFVYHREAVGYQQYCFYVPQASTWRYAQFSDLLGKRIAYLQDSGFGALDTYLKTHETAIKTTQFAEGRDFAKRLFIFLDFKRADAVVLTSDVYAYAVASAEVGTQFKAAGCLAEEKMAVGLSPARPARSKAIGLALDRGISQLRTNGQLKKILANYGMQVWPE